MDKIESLTTAGLISVALKESVKEYVNIFLKPKLENLHKKLSKEKALPSTRSKIESYLLTSCKNVGYIRSIAFSSAPHELSKLYMTLTLISKNIVKSKNKPIKEIKIKIPYQQSKLLEKYNHVSIVDAAGMGKTTILKCLFVQAINSPRCIPVFIDAKRLATSETMIDYIAEILGGGKSSIEREIVIEIAERGDFLVLIDGYDEVKTTDIDSVVQKINNFILRFNSNKFVITSRPESAGLLPPFFKVFNISPLTQDQAIVLIKKYDVSKSYSQQLIEQIKNGELPQITEFLTNPLLVSLLYVTYCYKKEISYFKKHLYYRNVFDALYESHDYSKDVIVKREKVSRLDIDDFHKVMRCFGFITAKNFQIEYTKDEFIKYISIAKEIIKEISFKDSDLLNDLCANVPLFTRDGNYYRWAHKSLQEYFAAQFICIDMKENQEKYLSHVIETKNEILKTVNIFEMCLDIDPKSFKKTILKRILIDFIEYSDELAKKYPSIDAKVIRELSGLTYLYDIESTVADRESVSAFNSNFKQLLENMKSNNIDHIKIGGDPMRITSYAVNNPIIQPIVKMLAAKKINIFNLNRTNGTKEIPLHETIKLSRFELPFKSEDKIDWTNATLILSSHDCMLYQMCKSLLYELDKDEQQDDFKYFM